MDGNRRWARKRGLPSSAGHKAGFDHIPEVLKICRESGIHVVSVYCWSTENWNRSKKEIDYIMNSLVTHLPRFANELNENGVRFVHSGRRKEIPLNALKALDDAVALTRQNDNDIINFCFNYGGRAELVESVRSLMQTKISSESISEQSISKCLWSSELPDVDIVIRTGGDQRLSNFMLWQASHALIHVTKRYWPDISRKDITAGIKCYKNQQYQNAL